MCDPPCPAPEPAPGPAPDPSAALRDLAALLEDHGLRTRVDPVARTLDATVLAVGARAPCRRVALRVLLRRHRGGPWWWLMLPGHETGLPGPGAPPEVVALVPLAEVRAAARRVFRALILDRDAAP